MHFGPFAAFVTVVARTPTALGRRLDRTTVQNRRQWLGLPLGGATQEHAQVMDQRLEAFGRHPAAQLLVDHWPRRQIVRQHTPVHAGLHQVAQPVEDLAQSMLPLADVFEQLRKVGRDAGPFLVADIRSGRGWGWLT